MSAENKPELLVTAFVDYICPFCYVGNHRLDQLRDEFDLKVYWRFVELHPETPRDGLRVTELGYPEEEMQVRLANLYTLAASDGLPMTMRQRTANSHLALLLAEAAKESGREVFYALHERLFRAFFAEDKNIADAEVLWGLAREAGMPDELVDRAWTDSRYTAKIQENLLAAAQLGIQATPTFFFGEQRMTGAVPVDELRQAARASLVRN